MSGEATNQPRLGRRSVSKSRETGRRVHAHSSPACFRSAFHSGSEAYPKCVPCTRENKCGRWIQSEGFAGQSFRSLNSKDLNKDDRDVTVGRLNNTHATHTRHPDSSVEEVCVTTVHTKKEDSIAFSKVATKLLPLAAPSTMSMALTFGLAVIPLAFIGSFIDVEALSGASVGYFIISIVVQYPLCGLTFAIDTLCSQAFGRGHESDEQGLILQRGVLVGFVFIVPCTVVLEVIQLILPSFYGEQIGAIACDFMRYAILFTLPLITFTAFSKFCFNQLRPHLPMTALVVGVIIAPVVQYFFVRSGVSGAMLGMALVSWVQLIILMLLIFLVNSTRMTFGNIRIREALEWDGLKEYLELALPSSVFVAAEASAFDITILLSATLSPADGAAWSAILNTLLIFVSFSGGVSTAACAKVGSSLGARLPLCAKAYVIAAVGFSFIISTLNGFVIYFLFDYILGLFGTNGLSLQRAHSVRWMIPIMHVADSVQFVFQGVFSGIGQNEKGARILLICLWCVGFPLELLFTYVFGWGLSGVLGGLTFGLLLESPAMIWFITKVNWDELSKEAASFSDEYMEEEEVRLSDRQDCKAETVSSTR